MEAVPRLPMLYFDLKISPESTSFAPKIKQYIRDIYREDPEMYSTEIHTLDGLRAAAVTPVRDVTGVSTLKKYYCQLVFLQSRFPIGKETSGVTFTWRDTYASMVCTLSDIRFEMVAILYNIGALHTQLGADDSRTSADGMKMACTHFQCAAWAFQHLKDAFPQPAGVDLAPEIMQFMCHLSLAQAQECILEKSMMDNRKATIIAKVAVQIVDFYNLALNTLEQNGTDECSISETVGSRLYKSWKKYVKFKIAYHTCVSLLYQGQQAEEQQKMGERVAYYMAASEKLEEAVKLSKGLDHAQDISETLSFTNDVVEGKKKAAKNENEFIYHEEVPDKDTLPTVKGASLVKGIPFIINDPEVSGPDLFDRLVPMKAHEASSLYSEEKAKLLRKIGSMIEEKDQELLTFMTSLQLECLSLISEPEMLPEELVERCAALNAKREAIPTLVDSMNKLSDIYHDVEAMLNDIKELIQQEETCEKDYQQIMGKRPPSIVATDLTREANKYQEAHSKASESNQTLHKAMILHISNLKILSLSLKELRVQLPSISTLNSAEDLTAVKELQHLVNKVEEMKKQRAMLTGQLRESLCQDDITQQLVMRSGEPLDIVFNQAMQKHQKYVSLIEQNLSAQENILAALTDTYAKHATFRKAANDIMRKREIMINALIASYDAYEDLLAKCSKGLEFYRKLETNVSKLLQRVKSTCKVQDEEREQILAKNNKVIPHSTEKVGPKLKDYLHNIPKAGSIINTPANYPSATSPNPYYNSNYSAASSGNYYDSTNIDVNTSSGQWIPSVRPAPVGSETTNDQVMSQLPCMGGKQENREPSAVSASKPLSHSLTGFPGYPNMSTTQVNDPVYTATGLDAGYHSSMPNYSYAAQYGNQYTAGGYPYSIHNIPNALPANQYPLTNDPNNQPAGSKGNQVDNLNSQNNSFSTPTSEKGSAPSVNAGYALNVQNHSNLSSDKSLTTQPGQTVPAYTPTTSGQFHQPYHSQNASYFAMSQQPWTQQPQQQNNQVAWPTHQYNLPDKVGYPSNSISPSAWTQQPANASPQFSKNYSNINASTAQVMWPHVQYPVGLNQNTPSNQNVSSVAQPQWSEQQTYPSWTPDQNPLQNPQKLATPIPSSAPAWPQPHSSSANSAAAYGAEFHSIHSTKSATSLSSGSSSEISFNSHAHTYMQPSYQYSTSAVLTDVNSHPSSYSTEYQYMGISNSSCYTNAGTCGTNQTCSSQTAVDGQTYAAQYNTNPNVPVFSQTTQQGNQAYYSLPYGYQYEAGNASLPMNPTVNIIQETTVPNSPGGSMTYMQASDRDGSTTTTFSNQVSSTLSTTSTELKNKDSNSASNIDLLAGLDFSLNHTPLTPQSTTISPKKSINEQTEKTPTVNTKVTQPVTESPVEANSDKITEAAKNIQTNQSNGSVTENLESDVLSRLEIPSSNSKEDSKQTLKSLGKDPLSDADVLNQFIQEVEKYEKFVESLTTKTLNGPTPLDMKWKELLELQERDAHKHSISVARCYPMKNRFPDLLPYDHSRVELPSTKDDYINASYMKSLTPNTPPFITTQAPLPSTYTDFWTMVYEQQTEVVVCLLSDFELQGQIYWPVEKTQELLIGKIKLTLQSSIIKTHWVERIISICMDAKATRVVVHLQLTSWPGSSFPASPGPFLSFVTEALSLYHQQRNCNHPVVVHCLSGVGRTGLFCLVTAAICEVLAGKGLLDLVNVTANMSMYRKGSLRDREHLKFAYQSVLYYAQDLLMKRGFLTSGSSFEDKRSRGGKCHTRHPSEDFLLDLNQLQSGLDKMGCKP